MQFGCLNQQVNFGGGAKSMICFLASFSDYINKYFLNNTNKKNKKNIYVKIIIEAQNIKIKLSDKMVKTITMKTNQI